MPNASMCVLCVSVPLLFMISSEPATIKVDADRIELRVGDSLAARYHFANSQIKPYFWPIVAPNGTIVTRGWPMEKPAPGGSADHVHQKSGWFTYGDVIPEGLEVKPKRPGVEGVDFWAEVPVHGKIVCVDPGTPKEGRIVTRNEWRMPDGTAILHESRSLSMHDLGTGRLLIVECDLHASTVPIEFGDTKEGAFGVRISDQLRTDLGKGKPVPPANKITNSNGKTGEGGCWGRRADWCDCSGEIDGKPAGIAIFDDPANSQRACWHVRGYGLLAANPFGREKSKFPDMGGRTDRVRLAKGEHLVLRYGIYAHDGDVTTGKVAEAFETFVNRLRK